jgi:hypothetical protein
MAKPKNILTAGRPPVLVAVYRGPLPAVEIPGLGVIRAGDRIPEGGPRFAVAARLPEHFALQEEK